MHGNLAGLVYSVLLIAFFGLISILVKNKTVSRKIVHIGVSNWFFIYNAFFDTYLYPVLGLLSFAVINYFFERKEENKSWGTVEYPLVVAFIVVLVFFGIGEKADLGCALLGMGYGDGLAAIFGTYFGKKKMPLLNKKTVVGSVVCFIVVSLVVYLLSDLSLILSLVVGLVAMAVEAYTPFGLDNITMPLAIFVLCWIF